MPCHNGERTLQQSIGSAIAQTFTEWELIVVDDGSADSSPKLLDQLAASDERIRVFRNDRPSGAAAARNRALEEARAQYIAFLDCDDVWLPHKLETQLRAMQEH